MKIIKAWIDDPREDATVERPTVVILVDEDPHQSTDAISRPIHLGSESSIVSCKFGPFIRLWHEGSMPDIPSVGNKLSETLKGEFNKAFSDIFPPIINIKLSTEDDWIEGNWGLPVKRARQILKKFNVPYRLLLNDRDAQHGHISWVPVRSEPICVWYDAMGLCGLEATSHVSIGEVDMTLCAGHLEMHNREQAMKRISTSR